LGFFPNIALVEFCTKWIRIKWGPGVFIKWYTCEVFLRTFKLKVSPNVPTYLGKYINTYYIGSIKLYEKVAWNK
jgi:hypothetical protein